MNSATSRRAGVLLPMVFAVAALALAAGGYWSYRYEARLVRADHLARLQAIGELKAGDLAGWWYERQTDVRLSAADPFLRAAVGRWLSQPTDRDLQADLTRRLELMRDSYHYQNVILATPEGRLLLAAEAGAEDLPETIQALVARTVVRPSVELGDLFRCPGCQDVHLDIAAPLLDAAQRPVAVLLLRVDPAVRLYPLLQRWPAPSPSAETLLVRREGDDALLLNTARHDPHPALTLRQPLTLTNAPAVQAVFGRTGPFEGDDYRGVPVLADLRPVPGTPWFLIAKVDAAEVLAETRQHAGIMFLLTLLGIGLAGVLTALAGSQWRQQTYQSLYRAERERREALEEFRATFELASVGMAQASAQTGQWLRVNQRMCAITGYAAEELLRLRIPEITHPEDRAADWEDFQRVARGEAPEYRREKRYVRKDGAVAWVNVNVTVLRDAAGQPTRTLAAIEDITGRQRTEEALRQSEEKYRVLFESARDAIMTLAPPRWTFTAANPAAIAMFAARDEAEFCATAPWQVSPEHQPDGEPSATQARRMIETAMAQGGHAFQWTHRRLTGELFPATVLLTRVQRGDEVFLQATVRDITQQRQAEETLRLSERFVRGTLDALSAHVCVLDEQGVLIMVNQAWRAFAAANPPVAGNVCEGADYLAVCDAARNGSADHAGAVAAAIRDVLRGGQAEFVTEYPCHSPEEQRWFIARVTRFAGPGPVRVVVAHENITQRKRAEEERAAMQLQMNQAQKLESIGRLAAGIAHEINTPTQFIGDNAHFLQNGFADVFRVLGLYGHLHEAVRPQAGVADLLAQLDAARQQADLDYLTAEIPKAIAQSLEGVARVTKIVRAMKDFSHPGREEKMAVNLNQAIESTSTVARNEWKYVADLKLDLEDSLPPVPVLAGEFNQVILNLVINAAHAIAEKLGEGAAEKGTITLSTRRDGDWVEVRVADTGGGIPAHVRDKIFTPFFTTKPVGKGTGQGLALARAVVVDKHSGTIGFESAEGAGTCFIIRLPLVPPNRPDRPK